MSTDPGGEPVCWLGQLCPECGAMPDGDGAPDPTVPCWRCGAVRERPEGPTTGETPEEA